MVDLFISTLNFSQYAALSVSVYATVGSVERAAY
jgi:hypothetical protein